MSINIGFKSNAYSLGNLYTNDSRLIVNSYNDSNAIMINTDNSTYDNAVINFKNRYSTGLVDNKYIVYDIIDKDLVYDISSNINFNKYIKVKNILSISSNVSTFTSNIVLQTKHKNDTLRIYNDLNTVCFEAGSNSTYMNNARVNNTLYVSRIENISGNNIDIINPNLIGLVLQSFNTDQTIFVNNNINKYYDGPTFVINRYDNKGNMMELGTCNIYGREINKQFIIDRFGMVGIGSKVPDAPLSISRIIPDNPYIMKYDGINNGEKFNIMTNGTLGIGTTNVKGMIHIFRDDNSNVVNKIIQNNPLLKLDIQYDLACNIIYTSNVTDILNTYTIDKVHNCNINIITSFVNTTSNLKNIITIITSNMQSNYTNITHTTSNFMLKLNNNIIKNSVIPDNELILKTSNIIYYPIELYMYELTSNFNYRIDDKIIYETHDSVSSNTSNFIKSYYYDYNVVLMSKNTYDYSGYVTNSNHPKFNADKFKNVSLSYSNLNTMFNGTYNISISTSSNYIHNVYYNLNMIMEDLNHKINYTIPNKPHIYDQPYFFYMSSNNDFKASLSSYGTLSLGSPYISNLNYIPGKYNLYVDGTSYFKKIEFDDIWSSNNTINFNNMDFSNINTIKANSNMINESFINIANIDKSIVKQSLCSNIQTTNLNIKTISSDYLFMNNCNIHFSTYFSVGDNNTEHNNSSLVKLIVNKKLDNSNLYFKNTCGLFVKNEINNTIKVNPSIRIIGYDGSIPYFNICRNSTDYFIRLNNKTYNYGTVFNSDVFEICCDNLTGSTQRRLEYYGNTQPSFINHIKGLNLLTFGELNNVCISCSNNLSLQNNLIGVESSTFTNGTHKICLGLPYGILEKNSIVLNDWPQYCNDFIMNTSIAGNKFGSHMLNIFGNTSISSIYGKTMMTVQVDTGTNRNEGAESVSVFVNGTVTSTGQGGTGSDSNIKTDIQIIDNALEKVNCINGYTFTNTITQKKDTGLIAQEVQKILPEAVSIGNDKLLYLAYGNMMGLLVESIKELNQKIDRLEKRMDDIQSK